MEDSIINSIFSFRETATDFILYERLLDISLKDSRLSNKFIAFTENLLDLGFKKKKLVKIVKKYFDDNAHTYKTKLNAYINNKWNQELYQLLLYCVVFENSNFISKKEVKNILTSKLDDYTACLCIMIWLKRKWDISKLLGILENLFKEVHSNYSYPNGKEVIRMRVKFWFLRYFVYSLINENIINETNLLKHYENSNCKKDRTGIYLSELNQKYTIPINSDKNIDKFYNLVLNKKVHLVQLGKDKDFKYI